MRWIVRPGDGPTVGAVLARAGADGRAVAEGRVFVGRRRVKGADEPIALDDVIEVATPREVAGTVRVLSRTRDLVAVDKPAGVPTIADHGGSAHALVAMTARALGAGEADLHPTSRLDRDVSGVVVFALGKAAIARLAAARTRGGYARRYVAIASHPPDPPQGQWQAPIGRTANPRLRAVASGARGAGVRDAVDAVTRYRVCGRAGDAALLAASPVTGRTHQIRVHAAHAGAALLGDRSYGGPVRLTLPSGRVLALGRIALHAAMVTVPDHGGEPLTIASPVPEALRSWWQALGGPESDWEGSLSCAV